MLAAAGSGQRLGAGGPKALVEVAGRPMLRWSLAALEAASAIDRIVVAAPLGSEAEVAALAPGVTVVAGGASRAESVANAIELVEAELVAVHDAARPLLEAELVDRLITRLADADAECVIAAAPVADTLKRAGAGGAVAETVDRSGLWGAQTPQAFRVEALRTAQARAREAGTLGSATDEATLLERAGGTVLLEPTGAPNPKVTDRGDLAVAEALLGLRGA